jgi:hypothetical protein
LRKHNRRAQSYGYREKRNVLLHAYLLHSIKEKGPRASKTTAKQPLCRLDKAFKINRKTTTSTAGCKPERHALRAREATGF